MIYIDEIFALFQYRIHSGNELKLKCYEEPVRYVRFSDSDDSTRETGSVVFGVESGIVYEINYSGGNIPYRWLHPKYRDAYFEEDRSKGFDPLIAYDNVPYIDVNTLTFDDEDVMDFFTEKLYPNDVTDVTDEVITIDLDHETLAKLALQAHEKNVTLNSHIVDILREEMENGKRQS